MTEQISSSFFCVLDCHRKTPRECARCLKFLRAIYLSETDQLITYGKEEVMRSDCCNGW